MRQDVRLLLYEPEAKAGKNRLHLDRQPVDHTRDEESSGSSPSAPLLADRRGAGQGWVVLADPEGNEFCMNTSPAERDAPG